MFGEFKLFRGNDAKSEMIKNPALEKESMPGISHAEFKSRMETLAAKIESMMALYLKLEKIPFENNGNIEELERSRDDEFEKLKESIVAEIGEAKTLIAFTKGKDMSFYKNAAINLGEDRVRLERLFNSIDITRAHGRKAA